MTRRGLIYLFIVAFGLQYIGACTAEESVMNPEASISKLKTMRAEQKFVDSMGTIRPEERAHLEPLINDLLDRLVAGLPQHPEKSWAIAQMKRTVAEFYLEDTELREPCLDYLERIFGILGIKDSGGAFKEYMIDI